MPAFVPSAPAPAPLAHHAQALAAVLAAQRNSTLMSLNLTWNTIGSAGAQAFACLAQNQHDTNRGIKTSHIRELNLGFCKSTPLGPPHPNVSPSPWMAHLKDHVFQD